MRSHRKRPWLNLALLLLGVATSSLGAEELPTAQQLLDRALEYHDPDGRFLTEAWCLRLDETRPSGSDRETEILVDASGERYRITRTTEHVISGTMGGGRCEMSLDGRSDVTDAEREEHQLSCERLTTLRDYYVYLWGLPMKLRDPGTRLESVEATKFETRPVYGLRVTYDPAVGGDVWVFYFDRKTYALVGYRFFQDEAKRDGEYIVLDGELEAHGMRLPRTRAWYTHQEERHLGTDILVGVESCAD